jgi:hypothetical protein
MRRAMMTGMPAVVARPVALIVSPVLGAIAGALFGSVILGVVVALAIAVAWVAARTAAGAPGSIRFLWLAIAGVAMLAALIQFVPYGHDHANPPVTGEPAWDTPETRALAVRACYDCHSNETVWPWYSDIAPVSWLTTNHIVEGRGVLNFSTWDQGFGDLREVTETIREGEMPPRYYTFLHSAARLSDAEQQQLIDGLRRTFAGG